jgi:2,4-dienoyl-CoA reductase-like NADH-dependent reductase (Old Yellow Enzyme family)
LEKYIDLHNLASMSHPVLSRPLRLPSGATLPNRIVKGAMSEVLGDRATFAPTDGLIRLYQRWANSGAGLLITGNVMVDRGGLGEPGNVLIEDDRHLGLLRRWADAAQRHGAQLWMQLNHTGRQALRSVVPHPVAPSAIKVEGFGGLFAMPRALTDGEIRAIIGRFAVGASIARAAGFGGIQLHGAHGYLISQFLSPLTNRRDDDWGGDPARRARFLVELVRAVRAAVGADFPIGVKLNSADFQRGGFTIEEALGVARTLELEGIDLLEVTGGNYEAPAMTGADPLSTRASSVAREAYFLDYARQIRAVTKTPLLLTGGMRSAATMAEVIESGAVDVVGMARPMAYDPDLPARLLAGTATSVAPVSLRTGIRRFDDMLQIFWFAAQLQRMASGEEPDIKLGKWGVLLRAMWHTLRPRAATPPSALPAPATA